MRYTVKLSVTVVEQITEYARFIAKQRRAPETHNAGWSECTMRLRRSIECLIGVRWLQKMPIAPTKFAAC